MLKQNYSNSMLIKFSSLTILILSYNNTEAAKEIYIKHHTVYQPDKSGVHESSLCFQWIKPQ